MRRYEKYKDSGVEWIGEIPEHWDAIKVKYSGKSIIGITYNPTEVINSKNGTLVLRSSNIQNGQLAFEDCVYVDKDIPDKYLTKEGDILICARNGSANLVGKSAYISKKWEGVSFGAFMSIVRTNLGKYLFYCFNSQVFKSQIGLFSTSTINQLTSDTLNNIRIALPNNTQEQTAIANFLDRKTAEIDTLIESKKRLLELYEEEKTAIINRAVTKGIDPDTPIKDSGIDWLGEIPEHWELTKIKYLVTKVGSGVTPRGGARVYKRSGIPLLRSQNVKFDCLDLKEVAYISEQVHNEMSNSQVQNGDVLLNITGASIGRTYYVEKWLGEANVNQHVCIIRPKESLIETQFLHIMLKSFIGQKQIEQEQTGSGREGLNFESLKNFYIPFTKNIPEQKKLISIVERGISRIEDKKNNTNHLIKLLQEYRESLINEVVTGKLKVVETETKT